MLEELGGEEAAKKALERRNITSLLQFNILAHRVATLE